MPPRRKAKESKTDGSHSGHRHRSLLSYAVNLFIFAMGSLLLAREPIVQASVAPTLENYTDPLPQSLVLTAIVIGFATSALFLVVMMALRGLTGNDHVDGQERDG